jgi:hypothetical protein
MFPGFDGQSRLRRTSPAADSPGDSWYAVGMDPSALLAGRTRETKIRRDRNGRWYENGVPLEHPNLTRSFDAWIDRAEDGRFCLSNDINWAYVAIEGPAYFVRDLAPVDGALVLLLSGDRREPLRGETLRQGPDGALYCDVREGRCPARFDNHAALKLGDLLGEDAGGTFVDLPSGRFRPPTVDDPLRAA